MKFTNYSIPLGLGVNNYTNNLKFHNALNYDGITNTKNDHNTNEHKVTLNQVGGNLNPCEMVFYVFEHKLPVMNDMDDMDDMNGMDEMDNMNDVINDNNVTDEEIQEERDAIREGSEDGDSDEEIGRAGRFSYIEEIGGETGVEDSVEDSEMSTDELLGDMNNNSRMLQSQEENRQNNRRKIKNLGGLFSDTTSHDSLRSILDALKQSTRSTK